MVCNVHRVSCNVHLLSKDIFRSNKPQTASPPYQGALRFSINAKAAILYAGHNCGP